jgi:hypothetical protein
MTAPQTFIQGKLLMSSGMMLSTEEIAKLDWSVFDGVDMTIQTPERLNAVYLIGRQIEEIRK